jgi:hypothetical protein
MTRDELKRLIRALDISGEVAGILAVITFFALLILFCVAGAGVAKPDVSFRWNVFLPGLAIIIVPWALLVLNGIIIVTRSALGRVPGRVHLTRAERQQLRKTARMVELARRTAELERDVLGEDV